ncbi:MAG: FG-GAP-like repeat-containing protein [Balneolales bacterium]
MKRPISLFLTCFVLLAFISCSPEEELPDASSEQYRDAVSNFYMSLAAIQTDQPVFAFNKMDEVARSYPDEPAAWGNLGLYAMRQGNYELASERLGEARELAPDNADILFLSSILENRMGNIEVSIQYLEQAMQADPDNLKVIYALVTELETEDFSANAGKIIDLLEQMQELKPENKIILLESMRVAAREGNDGLLQEYLGQFEDLVSALPDDAGEQLALVRESVKSGHADDVTIELAFLRNIVDPFPDFQRDLNEIQLPQTNIGFVLPRFLWLPEAEVSAASPDLDLTFEAERPAVLDSPEAVKSVVLSESHPPQLVTISGNKAAINNEAELDFPGGSPGKPSRHSVIEIDFNNDFLNDLAFAGSAGLKFYVQEEDFTFTDVTGNLEIPDPILNMPFSGLWPADIDMDGDLDIILAPREGSPFALRNNGDDTFTKVELFNEIESAIDFQWADLDGDGPPEALFLDNKGRLHLYENLRTGRFEKFAGLPEPGIIKALSIADINASSTFDIVMVKEANTIVRMALDPESAVWETETLAEEIDLDDSEVRVFIQDIDNNGRLDIVVSTSSKSQVWLGDEAGDFTLLPVEIAGGLASIVDRNGNERLDLVGISEGEPYQLINSGTKDYGARSLRARASGNQGDKRINSFGIGGEMEVRSGLLYQKQVMTSPIVHFGLGTYEEADMLRIIWPNGSVQAEFEEMGYGSTIFNEQILKGSCPWLFTNNGEEMQFVTDLIWRSALGLRINLLETGGVLQTLDRVRIPGEMLAPTDGYYDLRVSAELWETHYFDHLGLVAVDHPKDTEIFIDERFALPVPDLSVRLTETPKPFAAVLDDKGNDVTRIVSEIDENYLNPFTKTLFQGVVEDHYIEIVLGDEPPAEGALWLLASGWVRPTDSSINFAIAQGDNPVPKGIDVEIPDGNGGWKTVKEDYGFPAGKTKTIMLDLEKIFESNADRRLRLRSTTEVYWDAIRWAEGLPEDEFKETELQPEKMDLTYRGFSEWGRADSTSPKLPNYNLISGTTPRWRNLEGYHTRYGDISTLLNGIDDRYVIMSAGDEIRLRFSEIDEPEEGYIRSYVFVQDGWIKDGDYSTGFSETVLPLPHHGDADYITPHTKLSDDPVFLENRQDWIDYHTRYVTPELFRNALKF